MQDLVALSVRELQKADYGSAQLDIALQTVYGVDTQLIDDQTYYVVERDRAILGCGGWSYRSTLYGADQFANRDNTVLDPAIAGARIRAFFVHPEHARRGIATLILATCETRALAAGFSRAEAGATLTGIPFYLARGYTVVGNADMALPNGEVFRVVRMAKRLMKS